MTFLGRCNTCTPSVTAARPPLFPCFKGFLMEQYSWVGHGRNNLIVSLNSDTSAGASWLGWAGLGWAGLAGLDFNIANFLSFSVLNFPAAVNQPQHWSWTCPHWISTLHTLEWFGTGFTLQLSHLQWVLLTYLISPEPRVCKINFPPWVRSIASVRCLRAWNGFNQKQLEMARDFDRERREVPSLLVFSHQNG